MRLKRVRIFGFKTFADKTEFSLDGGVIAVVGPNGCGKSNLVDAILWGLGEGNARQLRAQTGQDVIFNGSSKRKAVGFAEVSLLFDNEDRSLPIDSPEVSITRRLTRSGNNEYSINKQSCRQRDVFELLADSGLGRAGYAIVGQKEIDAALSASVEDRRAWIDEAAGVQRYRSRKVEALRRLSQANEHLERVGDILGELESQREPLKEEAEQALRFKSIQGSLREVEVGLLVNEAASSIRELAELETKIEDSIKLSRSELVRAEQIDELVRAAGVEISELEVEMDLVRIKQQGSLTKLERSEADLRLAQQRLDSLSNQEKTLHDDSGEAEARIQEAELELQKLIAEEEEERTGLETLKVSLAGVGEEAKQLRDNLKNAETELERARVIVSRRMKMEADLAHRQDRRKLVDRELKGVVDALPELEEAVAEATKEFESQQAGYSEIQQKIAAIENAVIAIRQEDEKDAQSVRSALTEKASLEGRRRGIEATIDAHEGLTQGSRAVMEAIERGLLSGEYTPVGQAVETEKDYALAIETALGGSANDLICDHQSDAKAAVEWLKQHRAGRATFQPIPLMRPVEPSYELRRLLNESGIIGRASELVECSNKHRPVIDSLLGRVLIVEHIDDALKYAKTTGWSRMVTLDGEVVHSSGAVTGGQQSRQGYGLVQRKADLLELADQIEKLDKVVREFESRSSKRKQRSAAESEKLVGLREELKEKGTEVSEARSFLQNLNDELKTARKEQTKLEEELKVLATGPSESEPEIDLADFESRRDEALKALAAKSADADISETRLREAEERSRQAGSRLQLAQRRLQAAQEAEQIRRRRVNNLEPERDNARKEIAEAQHNIELARVEKAEADAKLAELQGVKRIKLQESLSLTEEAKAARANSTSVSDAAHQAEINRARADSRRAQALQRLYEEYSLTEEDAMAQEGTHEVPADAAAVVNKLRREMRAMGDVNLGAIEAYERLTTRFVELEAQKDDILQGIDQVQGSIRELDKLTRDRFVTTFEKVQSEFAQMFQKLFHGGEGAIELTNPDSILESGIDIQVTLPGKKRQQLNLLSGGERALCTAAFLFSLLKVKPSPLVVLDEVDAPLDGRNVERFAAALHELTENTQFIVITHNPTTIETAPIWLGVSMQEPGVSMLVPAKLPDSKAKVEDASAITPMSEAASAL